MDRRYVDWAEGGSLNTNQFVGRDSIKLDSRKRIDAHEVQPARCDQLHDHLGEFLFERWRQRQLAQDRRGIGGIGRVFVIQTL